MERVLILIGHRRIASVTVTDQATELFRFLLFVPQHGVVRTTMSSPWSEAVDPNTGKTYYVNVATRETSWNAPPGFKNQTQSVDKNELPQGWEVSVNTIHADADIHTAERRQAAAACASRPPRRTHTCWGEEVVLRRAPLGEGQHAGGPPESESKTR